ncbi:hypothetical protein GE061_015807 [Apolygus lucorum]|uniref:Uncharacterized protein n=1 Tax=Apolygus lucorum TaxID=248454 RepID=A0A8S9XP34_APOLU|nr:hypothetical protein GE061_015807 [Apolygus lucorum]
MATASVERTVRRRMLTILCKNFEEKSRDDFDIDELTTAYTQVETEAQRVFDLDEKVQRQLLEAETSEDVLMEEFTRVQEYRGKLYLVQAKYDRLTKQQNEDARSHASKSCSVQTSMRDDVSNSKRKFCMPKMDPIRYDGSLMGWIGFWGQFRKIHEDKEYDDDDKFQILLLYTVPGSKARKIVESFPPSGENYSKALEHLKSRCAKEEHLVEAYVRELLRLIISQVQQANVPLSSLYDSLQTQLRALETLGVTKDKYAAMLFPLVESCLPVDILRAWGRHRSLSSEATSSTGTDLEALMQFIKAEVESDERIQLATSFTLGEYKEKPIKNPEEPQPITPLQFIQDIDVDEVPDLDDIDSRRLGSRLRWRFQSRHCENCGRDLHETVTAIVLHRDIDLGGRRDVSQYSTAGVNPATSHHQIWTPGHTPEQIPGLLFRLGGCCV